jgi:hypothetical protein
VYTLCVLRSAFHFLIKSSYLSKKKKKKMVESVGRRKELWVVPVCIMWTI